MQRYSAASATPAAPRPGAEYDDFLFAPIGTETNGMLLSVLSALARMNVDPRKEAAALAELPRKEAVHRLSCLIEALPARPSAPEEPLTIAARLIKLLPHRSGLDLPLPRDNAAVPLWLGILLFATRALHSKTAIYVVVFLIGLVLAAQWFGWSGQTADGRAVSTTQTSNTAPVSSSPARVVH